ncbi:uncharacterized protein HD556DRAFT_793671 [Suillus plorans]|uniref:Uncharacterized protein n=1 Tax=Suillus plorans TaxID=116603 RepID=A0A9P7DSG0_9AGAM|nr:uncharacterized protein HD556DRAFT_793671 [Suillus plorans]KAG1802058.1 hypothetical protein HD556DRAFT_793671 [Suillus plorans]
MTLLYASMLCNLHYFVLDTMSDDLLAVLCASCVMGSSLQQWFDTHALGANCRCCSGPRGCCNSCFESSSNEDNFDEQLKKDTERREAAAERLFDAQPAPTQDMNCESSTDKPVPSK